MRRTYDSYRSVMIAVLLAISAIAMAGSPVAAQSTGEPAFIVDIRADGSAIVTVRSTFDLTTDSDRDAFQALMDDEPAQQAAADRFLDRLQAVARDVENATGREMRVTDATIDISRSADGDTGIVTLSVTWEGLAAVEGETLIVTEPFASGFSTDRPFVLRAPDGYTVASASPEPDSRDATSVSWGTGTDLTALSVELVSAETPTSSEPAADREVTETDGQPGFGLIAAVIAVLSAVAVAAIRRTDREGSDGRTS